MKKVILKKRHKKLLGFQRQFEKTANLRTHSFTVSFYLHEKDKDRRVTRRDDISRVTCWRTRRCDSCETTNLNELFVNDNFVIIFVKDWYFILVLVKLLQNDVSTRKAAQWVPLDILFLGYINFALYCQIQIATIK